MANQFTPREYRFEWKILYQKCSVCWERKESDKFPSDKSKKFWIRCDCKDCHKIKAKWMHSDWYKRNSSIAKTKMKGYYSSNKRSVLVRVRSNYEEHTKELWFDWYSFHDKAKRFARKYNLRPYICSLCWWKGSIEMHHPSYESFDKWCEVVFCCKSCHSNIHNWSIKCPKPINLLNLESHCHKVWERVL